MFIDKINGTITGVYRNRQFSGQEELPDDNPDIANFVNRPIPTIIDPLNDLRIALKDNPTLLDRIKALK